jgi:hypothetical protein
MKYKPTKKKVRCVSAATRYYETGQIYTIYVLGGEEYVKGADGYYDRIEKAVSKFVRVEDETKQQKGQRSLAPAKSSGHDPEEAP